MLQVIPFFLSWTDKQGFVRQEEGFEEAKHKDFKFEKNHLSDSIQEKKWNPKSNSIGDVFNADLANYIESQIPGKIQRVDIERWSIDNRKLESDIDINFNNEIWIEVKSSTGKIKMNQIRNQIVLSRSEGMEYVFYAEDLSSNQRRTITESYGEDVRIIESRSKLIEYLKEK